MRTNVMGVSIDSHAIGKLDRLPEVQIEMVLAARKIATMARKIAPRRTGHYRHGIRTRRAVGSTSAWVFADDFKSHWVEAGTRKMQARHPLRRAAEIAPGDFVPTLWGRRG